MNSELNLKSLTYVFFFIIGVLILYEMSGTKATSYFLILVLIGSVFTHIDSIKSLTK